MSDLLGEALARYDSCVNGEAFVFMNAPSWATIAAAARLVADAREPNYEAVDRELRYLCGPYPQARDIIAKALGVEPGTRVKVVVIFDE